MKSPRFLTTATKSVIAASAAATLIVGALVTPASASTAAAASSKPLPALGFSLNGEALSGPVSQSHYNTLADMSPGTEWARVGFTSDGKWRENVDTYLAPIRKAGMKVLLRASFRGAVYDKRVPLNAAEQARYGDFVRDLAQYVKTEYGLTADDVVFEHPNESNGLVSGAAYAGAAKNAYAKLKSVDPGYKIIGASENVYASNWKSWLKDVYEAGYASASDGVSFHNYDPQGDRSRYTFLENLMKKHGHWPAMVWLSEFGTTTVPGATGDGTQGAGRSAQSEAGQATRITGVLKFLRDEYPWITHTFLYADEDIPSRKSSDRFEAYFGIFANDSRGTITREKPAVQAIRDLYASAGAADRLTSVESPSTPTPTPTPAPSTPAPTEPVPAPSEPATPTPTPSDSSPSAPVQGVLQQLASFPLTSAAPSATGEGVTASPITGVGFRSGPRYGDFSPAYGRKVLQTNPTTTTASTNAAYVETVLTPDAAGDTVTVDSINLDATRGGDAKARGVRIVAVVDGVATTLGTQALPTQRPETTDIDITGLALEGEEIAIRIYPYSPVRTATVEMTSLTIDGHVTAETAAETPSDTAPSEPVPSEPEQGELQELAGFPLTSPAPAATAPGVSATALGSIGFRSGPRFGDFSPAYGRTVLQTNPTTTTASTNAAYVETVLTPDAAGDTVTVDSIHLEATRGGDAKNRGVRIVAVVDGVATTLGTQALPTQRPETTDVDITGLALEGEEIAIRIYPYSPVSTATVEMTSLTIDGRITS